MNWQSEGYILSVRKHGETSAIIDVFTRDKGRHMGFVRGGVGRRLRPVLQVGNKVQIEWQARLAEHLGYYTVEPLDARAVELMSERLSLAGLNAACAMAREALPEREVHADVFDAFEVLLANMHNPDVWPALYVRWEAGLLAAMGYCLDLSVCAATGTTENLTHISPRSGRAVCADAAEPYLDKLFAIPDYMVGGTDVSHTQIDAGLKLTGYFLETRLQWGVNRTLPEARARMVERLRALVTV